jgi:hypothetical protein
MMTSQPVPRNKNWPTAPKLFHPAPRKPRQRPKALAYVPLPPERSYSRSEAQATMWDVLPDVVGRASIACAQALIRAAQTKARVAGGKPKLITPDQIARAVRRHEEQRFMIHSAPYRTCPHDRLPVTEQVVAALLGYTPVWRHSTGLVDWIGPHPDPEKFASRASLGCPNPALLQIGAKDRIAIDPEADFRLWCAMALGALVAQGE